MSDTLLSGNWTVYKLAENRQARVEWTGTVTGTNTLAELYDAWMDLNDGPTYSSETTPMKYATPLSYQIGFLDAGFKNPYYIDRESAEHLTGSKLVSVNWTRSLPGDGTGEIGIIKMDYTETIPLVPTDIGKTIVMTIDGDTGTILDYNDTTTPKTIVIRPDDNTLANDFNDAPTATGAFTITAGTGTGTQLNGAAITGESIFANPFTKTTQPDNSTVAIYQDGTRLSGFKRTDDYWSTGDIDTIINVQEADVLVDEGYLTFRLNRAQGTYSFVIQDMSGGDRAQISMETEDDRNNPDGYRKMIFTNSANDWAVGDVMTDDSDGTIQGVVTNVSGVNPNVIVEYYLIGDPLIDFSVATGTLTNDNSGTPGTATAVDPSSVNASATSLTVTHGATTVDVDENGTDEYYSIKINLTDSVTVEDAWKRTMYVAMDGETDSTSTDGQEGQQYIGTDYRIGYTTLNGSIAEGAVVIQYSGGFGTGYVATGTVVAHHTTPKILVLRSSRDTFNSSDPIYVDAGNYISTPVPVVVTPIKKSPFGEYAAPNWICAPGVVLINVPAADVNKWETTDDEATPRKAPTKVTVSMGNTRVGDWVSILELEEAGGVIKTDHYTIDATQGVAGSAIIKVDPAIDGQTVGKTTGGVVFIVDVSAGNVHRYRCASWATDEFTLANTPGTDNGSGSALEIVDLGASFLTTAKVGDIVYNSIEGTFAYVDVVTDNTHLAMTNDGSDNPPTSWSGDTYEINGTVQSYTSSDTLYPAFIDVYETIGTDNSPGEEAVSVTYTVPIPVVEIVRQKGNIIAFSKENTIGSTGLTDTAIRNPDDVAT